MWAMLLMSEISDMVFAAFMQMYTDQLFILFNISSLTPLTYKHVFAHNFLNIQRIFNPKKVLESWDLELFNHTIQYCVY